MRGGDSEAQVGSGQSSNAGVLRRQSNSLPAGAGLRIEGPENHKVLPRHDAAADNAAGC